MKFLKDDFLLKNKISKKLWRDFAKDMPIIDYHCHVSAEEIYNNKQFENITQVWLYGDHYKWRLMRSNGIDEKYITGDATDFEKFECFAKTLEKAIGNPMYHWCHLELKAYFGFDGVLSGKTAKEVWDKANRILTSGKMRVRDIIKQSNVAFIGTTDDPVDTLEWHKKLQEDKSFKTLVAPSFRPDKVVNVDKAGFSLYIAKLGEVCGSEITSIKDLKDALVKRIDFFASLQCRASDHGLDKGVWREMSEDQVNEVLKKALAGESVTTDEADGYKSHLLKFFALEYAKRGWVMQLHMKALRNPNTKMLDRLGADAGFDIINPDASIVGITEFLNALEMEDSLPKTVIYSLDPSDNEFIGTLIGAFQGSEAEGKIQHGSAWWFNDNKQGMIDQITSLANLSLLGNFIGMLTDSRSFLSYTRHEYFRRILCNVIGTWACDGEVSCDVDALGKIVKDICFYNAEKYFNLKGELL